MIVQKIFALYESDARRKPMTGYPTGSRLGTCAAQLEQLRYAHLTHPEVSPPRSIMTWDEGNRTEEWLAEKLALAFPGLVGLRQEVLYGRVPLPDPGMVEEIRQQIARRQSGPAGPRLWGVEYDGPFIAPSIRLGDDGKVKLRLLPCGPKCTPTAHDWGCKKKQGFVLDPNCKYGPSIWVPTFIDFVINHDTLGLAIIEAKSQSDFSFRRIVMGDMDYGKRCQLAWMVEASGLPVILIAYRKNTSHMAEVAYTPTAGRVRVVISKMNGQQEVFFVDQPGRLRAEATGEIADVPADVLWQHAEVWTPYDKTILSDIHERVRRVLFAQPEGWHREAGPVFECSRCGGTGTQTLAKGGREPLKKPKPCEDCGEKGVLDEVILPVWPCNYCACAMNCWAPANIRLEITDKPRYWIKRADFEASGITFTAPGSARPVTEEIEV